MQVLRIMFKNYQYSSSDYMPQWCKIICSNIFINIVWRWTRIFNEQIYMKIAIWGKWENAETWNSISYSKDISLLNEQIKNRRIFSTQYSCTDTYSMYITRLYLYARYTDLFAIYIYVWTVGWAFPWRHSMRSGCACYSISHIKLESS